MATRNEKQKIVFTSVNLTQFLAVRAIGSSNSWAFQLSTYGSADNFKNALKSGIEALPEYEGQTVTLSGDFNISGVGTGTIVIDFSGAVNVPSLEVVTGAMRRFAVSVGDADSDYSVDGGATFALGISESDFQANQRALGGAHANVVCVGSSTALVPGAATVTLSSAGTPAVNGDYREQGTLNGYPLWHKTGTDYWIAYETAGGNLRYYLLVVSVSGQTPTSNGSNWQNQYSQVAQSTSVNGVAFEKGGYAGNVPAPTVSAPTASSDTPASASFYSFFPATATPTSPTSTGTGATNTTLIAKGTAVNVVPSVLVEGGVYVPETGNILTASGSGAAVDAGATGDTIKGYVATIQCVYTADPLNSSGVTVKIQHSDNGTSGWTDLVTFARMATIGSQRILSSDSTTAVKRYTRAIWTIDGSAPGFKIAVALVRKALQA